MIVDKINLYLTEQGKSIDDRISYEVGLLAQWSFNRQFMTDDESISKGHIRLSASGKCPRQLAYGYHGFEKKGKEMDSRSKLTFFAGDMVEVVIMQLAKAALKKLGGGNIGCCGRDQAVVSLSVNGSLVEGHPDGLFISQQGIYLVECKSMSSFGFKKFEAGEVDDSYLTQMNVYMASMGLSKCIMIAYNKDSNVLGEKLIELDKDIVEKAKVNILKVLKSTPETLPEAPLELEANDKGFYPWNCLYCSWWGICRDAEKVVIKNAYKLKKKGAV